MNKKNLAEGYNIFTGDIDKNHPFNTKFGEVHTGDTWLPARNQHCRSTEKRESMPIALVVFGDKSHID